MLKPNDLGNLLTLEQLPKVLVNEWVRQARKKMVNQLLEMEADIGGFQIEFATSQTRFGGRRYWFLCPICQRKRGVLYLNPINRIMQCRKCLGMSYWQQRYKGMRGL